MQKIEISAGQGNIFHLCHSTPCHSPPPVETLRAWAYGANPQLQNVHLIERTSQQGTGMIDL